METPLSLFLLIIAVGLILSTQYFQDSGQSDDSGIFRIRLVQARSICSTFIDHENRGEDQSIIDLFKKDGDRVPLQMILYEGSINHSSDSEVIASIVKSIIFTTPDYMPVSILLYDLGIEVPKLEMDHASWRVDTGGVVIDVSIPIHRVPMECLVVLS